MRVSYMNKYLIVALLGWAVGTLYAPKKGTELRGEIKDRFGEMHKTATETLEEVQLKSREIADKATVAIEQANNEVRTLRVEGEAILRTASENLQAAYDRSQSALQLAQERMADKAAPALAQVKEETKGLTNRASRFFNKQKLTRIGEQQDDPVAPLLS